MVSPTVALYLPSLRGGGAERVMLALANGFAAEGFDVHLVLAKAEGPYVDEVAKEVRVVDLASSRVLASLPGLISYLRTARPPVLLSAQGHANVVALAATRCARVPTRLVMSEHNHLSEALRSTNYRGKLMPLIMRFAYRRAHGVVAVSTGVADDLSRMIELPRDAIDVVYNPVVSEDLLARAHEPVDHPWFAAGAPPVILGVGRLTLQKDFENLLRAFAKVRQGRAARLVVLGEGPLRGHLEGLVDALGLRDDVSLPGFQPNPFAYMQKASVFALSSRFEGLPTVLIEAMACGTSVVATDCPSGPAEILENGRWGRLAPVGDPAALADALAATLDHPLPVDPAERAACFRLKPAVEAYRRVMGI